MGNPKLSAAGNVPIPSVTRSPQQTDKLTGAEDLAVVKIAERFAPDALYGHNLDCSLAVLVRYLHQLPTQRGGAEKGSSSWIPKFFAYIRGSLRIALCLVPILSTAACSPTKFDFPTFSLTDTQNSEGSDG